MIYFLSGVPQDLLVLFILCTFAAIIMGRHMCNFMNKKCDFTPSRWDAIMWLGLPLVFGFFALAGLVIVAFIEVNTKE